MEQNEASTCQQIDTDLTRGRSPTVHGEIEMNFDHENTRRDLIALRVKHGANSPIGHRCSSLIEMLDNFATATGEQKERLAKNIEKLMAELTALVAQSENPQ